MECDKLLRETLNNLKPKKPTGYESRSGAGIDLNSKTMTALNKIAKSMPNGKQAEVSMDSLKNMLLKEGVSSKEANLLFGNALETNSRSSTKKALEVYDTYSNFPNDVKKLISAEEFMGGHGVTAKHLANAINYGSGKQKLPIQSLMNLAKKNKIRVGKTKEQRFEHITKSFGNKSDYKVNGVYSDGADSAGKYGHFTDEKNFLGWWRESSDTLPDGTDVHVLHEFQSDWAQGPKKDSYPIDYSDFKKLSIVHNLDATIQKGLDTMIIPIDRSGSLSGSKDITKMYSDLQSGILPKIRKQLADKGLKIDVEVVKKTKVVDLETRFDEQQDIFFRATRDTDINDDIMEAIQDQMAEWDGREESLQATFDSIMDTLNGEAHDPILDAFGEIEQMFTSKSSKTDKTEDYFKIKIDTTNMKDINTPESWMKEHKKVTEVSNIKDIPDNMYIDRESLALDQKGHNIINQIETIGSSKDGDMEFTDFDVSYINDNQTISGRLAKHLDADLVGKVYTDIDDYSGTKYYSSLEGVKPEDIGYVRRTPEGYPADAEAFLEQHVKTEGRKLRNIPDDQEIVINLDNDEVFEGTIKDYKALKLVNPSTLIQSNDGVWVSIDEVFSLLDSPYDNRDTLARVVPGFQVTPKQELTKIRWDMLSTIGAIGLASQYEEMRNVEQ